MAMERGFTWHYALAMTHDLAVLLGAALREIRKRTTKTQDGWAERTGMSQSYISAAERGESGWDALRNMGDAIEKAGADPVDLLRIAVAQVDLSPGEQELLSLWSTVDEEIRQATLIMLRHNARTRSAAP